jgi:hypothetical protein
MMHEPLSALPLAKRARRYRELAAEAEVNAAQAYGADVRQGYRKIAQTWVELALQIERTFDCAPDIRNTAH